MGRHRRNAQRVRGSTSVSTRNGDSEAAQQREGQVFSRQLTGVILELDDASKGMRVRAAHALWLSSSAAASHGADDRTAPSQLAPRPGAAKRANTNRSAARTTAATPPTSITGQDEPETTSFMNF
ncbi:hypothetical protein TrVE_jg10247 [Triparma verrucosa]|uniref:Uncharacterized protein n=1 Tax=Triparma verrucosa TaxID=1606542 RepID=A0A9W7B8J0_9STRA|nr:hypothetical protein TrVE_jg10247 [Triparma verrucosa]